MLHKPIFFCKPHITTYATKSSSQLDQPTALLLPAADMDQTQPRVVSSLTTLRAQNASPSLFVISTHSRARAQSSGCVGHSTNPAYRSNDVQCKRVLSQELSELLNSDEAQRLVIIYNNFVDENLHTFPKTPLIADGNNIHDFV